MRKIPETIKADLILRVAGLECEVFCCVFVDKRNRVIAVDTADGDLDRVDIEPFDLVEAAMTHNAAAVILAHNHPSGIAEPSQADIETTRVLREALSLVSIRVLDHLVIGDSEAVSFAERGLL